VSVLSASVAPYDAAGLDYLAGMGESNVDEFTAAVEGEAALRPFLTAAAAEMAAGGPDGLAGALESILPAVDVAALDGGFAQFMYEWMDAGLRPGLDGWLDDDLAFVAPWGFDVAAIRTPVLLVHGRLDLMVPFSHGGLAGQAHAALFVNAETFDPDLVAEFDNVFSLFHPEVSQFADVNQAIFTRQEFHKSPKILNGYDFAPIDLANLSLGGHPRDCIPGDQNGQTG